MDHFKRLCVGSDGDRPEMAYTDSGNRSAGRTDYCLLLLHGLLDHRGTWSLLLPHFDERFRCIAPDLIGSGRSSKPALADTPERQRYSLTMQAAYLREFVRRLGVEEIILVGHSLGGGLALTLACSEWPDGPRVRGLVLIAAAAYPQPMPGYLDELVGRPGRLLLIPAVQRLLFRTGVVQRLVRLTHRRMFHDPDKIPEGHDEAAIDILRSKGIFYALRESARNAVPEDVDSFPERYRQISCPTLVIWGKEDRVVPALNALRLEADIPGARLHVFDECGHLPHLEYPHESAAVIRDWARYQL